MEFRYVVMHSLSTGCFVRGWSASLSGLKKKSRVELEKPIYLGLQTCILPVPLIGSMKKYLMSFLDNFPDFFDLRDKYSVKI